MIWFYANYLKKDIYVKYLTQECSLQDLLNIQPINLYELSLAINDLEILQRQKDKYFTTYWKIINNIPLVLGVLSIILCVCFVFWHMFYILQVNLNTYNLLSL